MGKLIGLAIFALDVIAILDCVKSDKSSGKKALWIVLILVLPAVGLIAYYMVGKKQ